MEAKNNFKFFIVDDDVFCANMHEQFLRNLNHTDITHFSNGMECLDNLHQKPDIIFLDHNMEEITGFEILKKIKRINPNIYVVMVSGQEEIGTAVNALKYGAFDYLIKDNTLYEKMSLVIDKIIKVDEAIKESSRNTPKKWLSIF